MKTREEINDELKARLDKAGVAYLRWEMDKRGSLLRRTMP